MLEHNLRQLAITCGKCVGGSVGGAVGGGGVGVWGGKVGCAVHDTGIFVGHDASFGAKHSRVRDVSVK
jgi:hypothetical protein